MFINSKLMKAIKFRSPVKLPLLYWLLACTRFILTILPQTGYIHPDEFFQNVEVLAGDILNVDVARTWEFNPKFPLRSIFVPKIILGPPLHFIRIANPYFLHYFNIDLKTPYYLLVIPRLFICLLSFINDYCLYKICIIYGQNFRTRLTVFASSYVVLVYCCRSFSNSFEMIFFSILLYLVAKCMAKSDKVVYHSEFLQKKYQQAKTSVEKVKIFKLKTHLPEYSADYVCSIAVLVVVGIFNRPTFLGFALTPVFFWFYRGLGSKVVSFKDFNYRFLLFGIISIPTAMILVIIDSFYYGYLTLAEIENGKIDLSNFVLVTLNFLSYNMDSKNLVKHGMHPPWLHVLINIPQLFNVLGIMAFVTLINHIYSFIRGHFKKLPRAQSITGLMMFSAIVPVILLSLFPHQEARFIIPILVPLVYLFGNGLFLTESDDSNTRGIKKGLLRSWYLLNIICTIFFGFVHQGGIYPFARDLHREIKNNYGVHTHVVSTHSYSLPTYLLQLESTTTVWKDRKSGHKYKLAPSTFIYRYGSLPLDELFVKVARSLKDADLLLQKHKKKYRFYIASPCSLERHLIQAARKYNYIDMKTEFTYYPHYTTEALPKFPGRYDQYCIDGNHLETDHSHVVDLSYLQRISCFFKKFCLRIYTIRLAAV